MSIEDLRLQFLRGTAAQNNAYAGADGELTVDSTLKDLRVHDGVKKGGYSIGGVVNAADTRFTVGAGGDFNKLVDALNHASRLRRTGGNYPIVIVIKSGHVIEDHIYFVGGDLSHIHITSEDDVVGVNTDSTDLSTQTRLFNFVNSNSPVLDVLFENIGSRSIDGAVGVNGSHILFAPGSGVRGFRYNLYLSYNSTSHIGPNCVFTDAVSYGVFAIKGSRVTFDRACDVSRAGNVGLNLRRNASAKFHQLTATDCGELGIHVFDKSDAFGHVSDFSRSGGTGIKIQYAGVVQLSTCVADDCGDWGIYSDHSFVEFRGSTATNCGSGGALVNRGNLFAQDTDFSNNPSGVALINGAEANLEGASVDNYVNEGVAMRDGSKAILLGAKCNGAINDPNDLILRNGSVAVLDNRSELDTATPINTITPEGIVYKEV